MLTNLYKPRAYIWDFTVCEIQQLYRGYTNEIIQIVIGTPGPKILKSTWKILD